ncbi:hypothetical protein G6F26_013768 [Rhizopus arrhizus]|nr:hypothetical protein G6F30_013662 [Rhizopus arrhizus]KAG0972923.1 hypothetical protein G6F28_013800 [Rhizopus arrhizus]KAG1007780.1 hypothetical protein G6F26_013768 [Rhizopus arrhizus]KAG1081880.1 hypothetical protein G6F39_013786 [Rhizopus arrhizus]
MNSQSLMPRYTSCNRKTLLCGSNNDAAPPTTKVSKLPNPKPKHSLAAIARQFSSPTAPSSFKFIHVPIHRRLPIHQLRANLRELHINTRRILDIQYSDRNVVSFLIHTGFEPEFRSQLYKHKITCRETVSAIENTSI